jgi:hypothetical protein
MNTSKPNPNANKNSSASIAAMGTNNPDVEMGRSRRSNLDDFLGKFSPSATEDQEPEVQESELSAVPPPSFTQGQHYSRPGAVHVDGISETTDAFSVTMPSDSDQVPEIHQSRESTQGEYLAEANLVLEPDLVFGVPLEEPKPYWSQPKVRRRALFVFLLGIGAIVGVGVGVGVGVRGGEPDTPVTIGIGNGFDCSNTTFGCLYTGTQSLGFQDPDSFLVANCADTNFEIPRSDNCGCEVNVPTSTPEGFESCQSCSFIDSADGEWRLAYDCSNLLRGGCVGLNANGSCISRVPFETTGDLRRAVDDYLANNSTDSEVTRSYGWPIGVWDVSQIEDFSYLFSADDSVFPERFNLAAANFNEDISGWELSSATTMTSMFDGAGSFDQPIGNWNVSRATDMSYMFSRALSFDQPLGDWNVSRVTDMRYMFYSARSLNQLLVNWEVSSVRDLSFMFAYATSFNQSFADWNVSNETDIRGIFTGADGIVEVQVQVEHDGWPTETGWTLRDSTGTLISSQAQGSFSTSDGTVTETSSVALGTYTFEITDSNGICCGGGSGSFSIAVNGETVISNDGRFKDIVQETFEVRAPTPSRFLVFQTREELREAVDLYLADSSTNTLVARNYGWPIGVWDVSKIQDFGKLFEGTTFNEPIGNWNVSSAVSMLSMFEGATSFNQSLVDWEVSSVKDMNSMFDTANKFDQPLGNWDVSSVTDMAFMFLDASSFNQPLGEWNVSSVTRMTWMFLGAESFNQPLADWNVSSETDIMLIFSFTGCPAVDVFEQSCFFEYSASPSPIAAPSAGPSAGPNSSPILIAAPSAGPSSSASPSASRIPFETTSDLRSAVDDYLADNSRNTLVARTYGWPIGVWDVSQIQDFSYLFTASDVGSSSVRFNPTAATFNEDISNWTMSSATSMNFMFYGAASFDQPIGVWNVSSVKNMRSMFYKAASFNQSLADWNVSHVANMPTMFYEATSFDQPLADWNVSSVKNMRFMFAHATSFNQPLADWNLLSVTDVSGMFNRAASFNQPLADWNVSSATTMAFMFAYATSFNQPIGNWDVSSETDLTNIFGNSGCPGAMGEESCFYVI